MTVSLNTHDFVFPEELTETSEDENRASFVLHPLERGFGHTIGNSIRRVLMSSLPGAAVWAFRADGVQHEHQTIDNVVEDVHQLIQNLKRLVLVLDEGKDSAKLSLSVHEPGAVTGHQLKTAGPVTIMNPDLVLFDLQDGVDKDQPLTIDMWVNRGRGFVMAEHHEDPEALEERDEFPVGTIRIDSVYNPVTSANFSVRETRVGQRTDFDWLQIDVETNGAIKPKEALTDAAEIARHHLGFFSGQSDFAARPTNGKLFMEGEVGEFGELETRFFGDSADGAGASGRPTEQSKSLEEVGLETRIRNRLETANIYTVGDVAQMTKSQLLKVEGIGDTSLKAIVEALDTVGLGLKVAGVGAAGSTEE